MKRLALLLLAAALLLPATANAQLTMQMSNGWAFTFTGNVNAFGVYTKQLSRPGAPGPVNYSVRTGLLPTFAQFEAKGKEAGLDVGVHFGFAPQIQNRGNTHDVFVGSSVQAGAQIDMREVWLTVGSDKWGQILAGRALGVYQRQNIVNDQTLFGIGAVGIGLGAVQGGGTTLGRIGYGYIYPNFNAQLTYSSPAKNLVVFSFGLFQPSVLGGPTRVAQGRSGYKFTRTPRIESEVTYRPKLKGRTKVLVWVGGEFQAVWDSAKGGKSVKPWGTTGGARVDFALQGKSSVSVVGSFYYGKGLSTTLGFSGDEVAADTALRRSDGGIAQLLYTYDKVTIGGSYGYSRLRRANKGTDLATVPNVISLFRSYTGGIYYQWTKSVKAVLEVTREQNNVAGGASGSLAPAQVDVGSGLMLFF